MSEEKSMNRTNIKRKLERIRRDIEKLQKQEKETEAELEEATDAANLKLLKKTRMTPEQLAFFNGLKEEEIRMILETRKEAGLAKANEEKKKTDRDDNG